MIIDQLYLSYLKYEGKDTKLSQLGTPVRVLVQGSTADHLLDRRKEI